MKIFPERVDIVAGLSVAGLLLPEAVAYASIAGLPPQHALFAGVAGLVCYAIFGGSRFAIVSPTSSSAAIVAAAATSATTLSPDEFKLAVAGAVLLTGAFFVVAGLAHFGSLSNFISRPVLKGFAFGIGVTIVAKQIVTICGVHGIAGNPFQIAAQMVERLGEVKRLSVIIGVAALSVLVLLKRLPSVPGAFVVLLAGIALSYATDLEGRGVALAGRIDIVPFAPSIPHLTWQEWSRLGQVALPLFLIVFAESWGAMRTLALQHGDTLEANRELVALGVSNIASGLIRGMPVGAGFSASSANESAGATSRLAGLCAAIVMAAAIAVAGGQIARVPEPVVAAVVISALLHALDPRPLVRLWRLNKDQYVAAGRRYRRHDPWSRRRNACRSCTVDRRYAAAHVESNDLDTWKARRKPELCRCDLHARSKNGPSHHSPEAVATAIFRECGSNAFPHRRPRDDKRRSGGDLEPGG